LAQLAELLSQASLVAAEISRSYANTRLNVPELKRPKNVSEDREWFWSDEWQAGERQVNQELKNGEYQVFDNVDDAIAELHRHV
jgi:hypothetical protein